jgi:hypothetical protein
MKQDDLERWEGFKEIVGAEHALQSLELALGTWLLTDHVKFILRMEDYDSMAYEHAANASVQFHDPST